jgi:hypothetical protein
MFISSNLTLTLLGLRCSVVVGNVSCRRYILIEWEQLSHNVRKVSRIAIECLVT